MQKTLLSIGLCIGLLLTVNGQTLKGGVLGMNNEKVHKAKIYFKKSGVETKTNRKGEFEIEYSSIPNDTLVAEAKGYQSIEIIAEKFTPGNTAVLYFIQRSPKKRNWFRRLFYRKES